jgi:hypothetical protein
LYTIQVGILGSEESNHGKTEQGKEKSTPDVNRPKGVFWTAVWGANGKRKQVLPETLLKLARHTPFPGTLIFSVHFDILNMALFSILVDYKCTLAT